MPSIGLLPAMALLVGTAAAITTTLAPGWPMGSLPILWCLGTVAWRRRWPRTGLLAVTVAFLAAGAALGADARTHALQPPIRARLDERIGGFALDTLGPEAGHDPLPVQVRLTEDAAPGDGYVTLRTNVTAIEIDGILEAVAGGVTFSVSGSAAAAMAGEWTAGRTLRMFATFRRPARYLNDGVPDFERELALDGTALLGSVKSGWLVEVLSRGSPIEELAARARAFVRRAVSRRVGRYSPLSAGIVTAVLIGDRTGLPDEIRDRLQAAGTYHVIAISGGNIAILAAIVLVTLSVVAVRGRTAAAIAIVALVAYAQIVTAGPSVWRATLMAVLYFAARALDHEAPAWHVTGVAAGLMAVVHPLDVRSPGFVLTFGATAALLEGARRGRALGTRSLVVAWALASMVASLSTEVVLLPVSAQAFSRVTFAGIFLNLLAVPLMGVVQVAGLVAVLCDRADVAASAAGLVAHVAAASLVGSARLVDVVPWLSARVPPPGAGLLVAYYAALAVVLLARRRAVRTAGGIALAGVVLAIACGIRGPSLVPAADSRDLLRLTVFDVGQGESMLLQLPDGRALLVDAGGVPFGSAGFDIGARVLAPALWARGIRTLDTLLLTHGDPDHIGGARSIVSDFAPRELWEGIRVPRHAPMEELRATAVEDGIAVTALRAGDAFTSGAARVRVLHPQEPDWERQRVRNDDSVVLEVVYRDMALLLTGDISTGVERALVPQLAPARIRVLKVAHHGSRTSTSPELLDAWRPHAAIISSGRGNPFGHPAPEVLDRLASTGATILRTDRHGQITLETDGRTVSVRTYTGATLRIGQ